MRPRKLDDQRCRLSYQHQAIGDYAVIGDTRTAALVGRDGSIDWLCMPDFDSPACFAKLLGDANNGYWCVAPRVPHRATRRYRGDTLILETCFETAGGAVTVRDFMTICENDGRHDVIREVYGERGVVAMSTILFPRLDYGHITPWTQDGPGGPTIISGPDALRIESTVPLVPREGGCVGEFTVSAGEIVRLRLVWFPSYRPQPCAGTSDDALRATETWWSDWASRCTYEGPWRGLLIRSLLTLKALTHAPTGATVAAATTSLPEQVGGVRNWDYRVCWLRDSTFLLYALLSSGYTEEAKRWRQWLLRALAGEPLQMQIMYGIRGERRLPELELPWLAGYRGSRPVRIGNDAHAQLQLDVYGELMDSLYLDRKVDIPANDDAWAMQRALLAELEQRWREPDNGIWEMRGPRQHFTHSKLMAWVAMDRAIKTVDRFGREGDVERWRGLRREMHDQICREGFDVEQNCFVQAYGSKHLDASLLMMPLVGFLPVRDPRIRGTIAAVQEHLMRDGLVVRYCSGSEVDGLPTGEGVFLPCSFWLVDCLAMLGEVKQAEALFDRLIGCANDVGLLAEEYDPGSRELLGNFPQAMSHMALINTVYNLTAAKGPAVQRSSE